MLKKSIHIAVSIVRGVPKKEWLVVENPMKMDDDWGPDLIGTLMGAAPNSRSSRGPMRDQN